MIEKKVYEREDVYKETLNYFNNDELATNVWIDKYCLKDKEGNFLELTPDDMHKRLASEFARIEAKYPNPLAANEIFDLLKDFKYIIPGGSILYGLGNNYSITSLGNCFVIGNKADSYGGIFLSDQEQAQLMKRRAGVGQDISHLRPNNSNVTNSAGTSTGAVSFMNRYSNTTREVAQDGRRGALMISMDVNHSDIEDFITSKDDLTKITGANISVKIDDKFMQNPDGQVWNKLVTQSWKSAEPGILFWDKIKSESIPSCYGEEWEEISTNPCFHPDTLIETVNGRVKIKDITQPTFVYSMDKHGKLCIKRCSASFISKKNEKVLKITLRNGNFIKVTKEHKLAVQGLKDIPLAWIEAENLEIGDRLIHLTRNRRGKRYSGVKLTSQYFRDYKMEHHLVWESINGKIPKNSDIHHIDGNTFNNNINNLELLSHSNHAKHTAENDNPQKHQIRNEKGRFISPENKYLPKIENIPDELKTNLQNKYANSIISIEEDEIVDVYDIQVEDTNCLLANNVIAHNCGEIPLCAYDSCRLISINLYSFVKDPFTVRTFFDYQGFYEVVHVAQRLMDDVVDLEEEKINKILTKIGQDPEPYDIKQVEINLWLKIKKKLLEGRRTGLSAIGLADTFAALGFKYGTDASIELAEMIYKHFATAAYKSSIDLAKERGCFPIWNPLLEKNNPFLNRLNRLDNKFINYISEHNMQVPRRNITLLTIPPSGTISLLAGISSGVEPVYQIYYKRRRKINPGEKDKIVVFTDQNGDSWEEYFIYHPKYELWKMHNLINALVNKDFIKESSLSEEELMKQSPYYKSTSYEIDPIQRVKLQATIQKWIDHSISSTINLPETTTKEEISNIYLEAWKQGCKGITIYRNNSRTGVLVDVEKKKEDHFHQHNAPKRPKELNCEAKTVVARGNQWLVIIGLYENKPYEVFALPTFKEDLNVKGKYTGKIIKKAKGIYDLELIDGENNTSSINNFTDLMSDEENNLTRMISTALRHGSDIKFVVEQLNKSKGDITSFAKSIARSLKVYLKDGDLSKSDCPNCGNVLIYQDGCEKCTCGFSKCS